MEIKRYSLGLDVWIESLSFQSPDNVTYVRWGVAELPALQLFMFVITWNGDQPFLVSSTEDIFYLCHSLTLSVIIVIINSLLCACSSHWTVCWMFGPCEFMLCWNMFSWAQKKAGYGCKPIHNIYEIIGFGLKLQSSENIYIDRKTGAFKCLFKNKRCENGSQTL